MGHFGFSEPRSSKDALCLLKIQIAAILASSLASCRDSSVVEHFHGKEGVSGSNPDRGSRVNTVVLATVFTFYETCRECTRDRRSRVHSEEEREENPESTLDFLNRRRALRERSD